MMTDKIIILFWSLKHMINIILLLKLCLIFVDYFKNKNRCGE